MNIYVPLGLFLVLLCFFFGKSRRSAVHTFAISMVTMLVFSAIRFNFGPDYMQYLSFYEHGEQGRSLSSYMLEEGDVRIEPLFRYYIQLFPKYTMFIITNALLWFGVVYYLCRKYVDLKYGWIVMLFLLFNINCMINNYVAMRTSLAAVCFVPAFYFLIHKRRWLFVLFVVLGAMFHKSTIVLLLLVFLSGNKDIITNRMLIIVSGVVALMILFAGQNVITVTLSRLVMDSVEDMNRYALYVNSVSSASFTINAFIFKVTTFICALYLADAAQKETEREYIFIYKIGIIAALLVLLLGQNLLTDRFLMIFNPFYIIAIIRSFRYHKRDYNMVAGFCVLFVSFYMFYNMINAYYSSSFQTYQTIFSAPYIP